MKALRGGPLGAMLAAMVLFCGCVSFERSYPDRRYFVLEVPPINPVANPGGRGVLQLATVRVSPRYADRNFVYRRSDARFESDYYNQFLIPPSALVTEEIRRALERAAVFQYVVGPTHPLSPTHVLDSSVNVLYGDFRDLQAPQAVMEMEFFLSREAPAQSLSPAKLGRTDDGDLASGIVLHKKYHKVVPVTARTPEALVQGWNKALEEIVTALIADLKATKL
jgi:cholesterol transport system auxiliary component